MSVFLPRLYQVRRGSSPFSPGGEGADKPVSVRVLLKQPRPPE